eukprot:TRINITY_DN18516_c0_g1_i1.p1 TRINITY_DN18516_c0_g1~~TRINITY_DN18516_c0_g1_i1.p1  ORF type:complete len:318 (-),score=71.90 TRINITY_DN18516_c0_g1_i1:37-990(-)
MAKEPEAHDIGDGVFLGSVKAATDGKLLERLKITHILVVDKTSSVLWPNRYTYKRVKLEDVPTANLLEALPEALAFMGEAQLKRGPILVHCTRGVSRSASVVIAYLMLSKGLSYDSARLRVEKKRQIVYPNLGFEVQLQHLQALAASVNIGRHWGEKMKWLRSAVPKGDLTAPHASFEIRAAMGRPTSVRLKELESLLREAKDNSQLLADIEPWKSQGLFFSTLQQYKTIPKGNDLIKRAVAIAQDMRKFLETQDDSASALKGIGAIASDLEAWIKIASPTLEKEVTESTAQEVEDLCSGSEDGDANVSPTKKQRTA